MDMTVLNASGVLALGQRIVVSVDGTIKVLEDGQPLQAGMSFLNPKAKTLSLQFQSSVFRLKMAVK